MPDPASRRGRTHDAEGTREAILNAAEQVFAEHGFDGARIDLIAQTSGYNKSLIFQYFDDKLGLYSAVIRRADDQTRDLQNDALNTLMQTDSTFNPGQLRDLFGGFIGWYFDYLLRCPNIQRIYMWEMAEGWQTFSKIASQRDYDDIDQFGPALGKLQTAGLLRSELNPLLQFSPALYVCNVYLSILPLYRVFLPGTDFNSPDELKKGRDFVISFIINGLLITPPKT
jgi:TetR/AcrR family transcriptional regulator